MENAHTSHRDNIVALVIGPGGMAVSVIEQLQKNKRMSMIWVGKDLEESEQLDQTKQYVEKLVSLDKFVSPMNLNDLIEDYAPDIVFWCQRGEIWESDQMLGSVSFDREMLREATIMGDAPVLTISVEQDHHHEEEE